MHRSCLGFEVHLHFTLPVHKLCLLCSSLSDQHETECVSLTASAGGLPKERKTEKENHGFFSPLSSPIFRFPQLTEFCSTHLTRVLLFSRICKHLGAFVAVQVHSSVCGLQRWLFDCLISKTYRQWQLHPSACLPDGQAFADGVTIHRHVCVSHTALLPYLLHLSFFLYSSFFYPIWPWQKLEHRQQLCYFCFINLSCLVTAALTFIY